MELSYDFFRSLGQRINSGESRVLALTGNIFDLFFSPGTNEYEQLLSFLFHKWDIPEAKEIIKILYKPNGPIRFLHEEDKKLAMEAWSILVRGTTPNEDAIRRLAYPQSTEEEPKLAEEFEAIVSERSINNPATALEFLRQLCQASRMDANSNPLKGKQLLIVIEAADLMIPEGKFGVMSEADRRSVVISRDWFNEPDFLNGKDTVVLITESVAKVNEEIRRLPQLIQIKIKLPDKDQRKHFTEWFQKKDATIEFWAGIEEFAAYTSGLTLVSMRQMLKAASYTKSKITPSEVIKRIAEFLVSQLGEGVVEFKKPKHLLDAVIGNERIKEFLLSWFIPRIRKGKLSGATVGGPIGAGKTYLFEAVASILGIPVIVLKNIRSKWFGETDFMFDRLQTILESFHQVMIFVDEADTQFGSVGPDAHDTERRLTGKIQAMMGDSALRGKVIWLLITARIHLLSNDLLRKGRAGDVIFAITDPAGKDRRNFIRWILKPVAQEGIVEDEAFIDEVEKATAGFAAADFSTLKEDLIVDAESGLLTKEVILRLIKYKIPADTSAFRRIQTLNALLRCNDRRLLPQDYDDLEKTRNGWKEELAQLVLLHGAAA